MYKGDLRVLTKKFALKTMAFTEKLPKTRAGRIVGDQLFRSGTSVYANYRAVCRARSTAEFIAKFGIVEEEADESLCWIELLMESGIIDKRDAIELYNDADRILSMTVNSIKTAKKNNRKK